MPRGWHSGASLRLAGVNYAAFASWIRKRRHARGDYARGARPAPKLLAGPRAVRLVEAVVPLAPTPEPAAAVAPGIEVLLPGGSRVLVADARQAALAAQLINALRVSSSC